MAASKPAIRSPAPRDGAGLYLVIMLVTFGLSVALVRLFLVLTGYPQVGGQTFHIAHALWGGLLLAVGAVIPLLYADARAMRFSAGCAGVGAGLFVDEVGKFITQRNDYFFPLAAPIIYFFLVLTAYLTQHALRRRASGPRSLTYLALEQLHEALDRDLEPEEREQLLELLARIEAAEGRPDLRDLAVRLRGYLESDALRTVHRPESRLDRLVATAERWEARYLPRPRARWLLVALLALVGVAAAPSIVTLAAITIDPQHAVVLRPPGTGGAVGEPAGAGGATWIVTLISLGANALSIAALATAIGALVAGQEELAVRLAGWGVVTQLAVVNVLNAYFSQISIVVEAAVQLGVLLSVVRYRRRFLAPLTVPHLPPSSARAGA